LDLFFRLGKVSAFGLFHIVEEYHEPRRVNTVKRIAQTSSTKIKENKIRKEIQVRKESVSISCCYQIGRSADRFSEN